MKKILSVSILFLLFFSACKETTSLKIERDGEPDVLNVAMNRAIEEANITLSNFKTAIQSNNKNYYGFTLKQKFKDADDNSEHIWIQDITMLNLKVLLAISLCTTLM